MLVRLQFLKHLVELPGQLPRPGGFDLCLEIRKLAPDLVHGFLEGIDPCVDVRDSSLASLFVRESLTSAFLPAVSSASFPVPPPARLTRGGSRPDCTFRGYPILPSVPTCWSTVVELFSTLRLPYCRSQFVDLRILRGAILPRSRSW